MNEHKNPDETHAAEPAPSGASVPAGASRFEKYATTQAAGDGIEGDVKKKNKTEAEKLAAQMADRK